MDFNPFSSGIPVFYGMYSISIASLRHYKRRDRGRSVKARKRKRAEGRAPLDPRVFRRACDYARSSSVSAWAVAKAAAPTAAAAATAAAPAFKAPSSPGRGKGLGVARVVRRRLRFGLLGLGLRRGVGVSVWIGIRSNLRRDAPLTCGIRVLLPDNAA